MAAAPAAAVVAVFAPPAGAASCAVMRVDYALPSGRVLELSPPRVSIRYGGCVQFTNNTIGRVTVTVTGGYHDQLDPGETTPAAEAFVGRRAGRQRVTASSGPTSADGTITVGRRPASATPAPSPSPSRRSQPSPTAAASSGRSSPPPSPAASGPSALPPQAVPPVTSDRSVSPRPSASAPVVAVPSPGLPPAPTTSPTPVALGGVEPPSGRGTGLPAAVAALAVAGTGAALVRVLLAEPAAVDNAATVGGGA